MAAQRMAAFGAISKTAPTTRLSFLRTLSFPAQVVWPGNELSQLSLRNSGTTMRRSFASSGYGEKDLKTAIKAELDYEQSSFAPDEELKVPPGGYSLTDNPGDGQVTLTKIHGKETISVTFEVNGQPDPEPDIENEEVRYCYFSAC